jgi:kumamolisin
MTEIKPHPHCVINPHASSAHSFYPVQLKQVYNYPLQAASPERINIVIPSFGGGLFGTVDPTTKVLTNHDFTAYWQKQGLTSFPTLRVVTVGTARNLPNAQDSATVENCLDMGVISSLVPNSTITLIIGNGFPEVLQAAKTMNAFVISVSWGFSETGNGMDYVNSVNAILKDLSESGINVCCSAGDSGANDGTPGQSVDFPGSSPYVTCCGGTTLLLGQSGVYDADTQETVWNNNPVSSATGGGQSVIFPKPSYQANIPGTHRMVPDVAMDADPNTCMIIPVNGHEISIGGTSAVSPMFASYVALTRCSTFINPLLYAAPKQCFHDITKGNNGGTNFQAGPGYDMCTGLGSVNGILLQSALQSVMPTQPTIIPSSLTFTARVAQQLAVSGDNTNAHTWTSSDVKVAIISTSGLVTPVGNGACSITCSGVAQIVSVTVSAFGTPGRVDATGVFILPQLGVGQSLTVGLFNTQPTNATTRTMVYYSQNPNVASVNVYTGEVKGLSPGLVTIVGNPQGLPNVRSQCSFQVVK